MTCSEPSEEAEGTDMVVTEQRVALQESRGSLKWVTVAWRETKGAYGSEPLP